jgi:hypothetical protein
MFWLYYKEKAPNPPNLQEGGTLQKDKYLFLLFIYYYHYLLYGGWRVNTYIYVNVIMLFYVLAIL